MSERDDDSRTNDIEGQLFALARSEAPTTDVRQRTLVALGVGASVATVASIAEAASVVKAGALAGASAAAGHGAKAIAVVSIVKWAAVGALAGTVVLGGAVGVERLSSSRTATTVQTQTRPVPTVGAPAIKPSSPAALDPQPLPPEPIERSVNDRLPVPQASAAKTGINAGVARAPEPSLEEPVARPSNPSSSLEEEVTRIDRARVALSSGGAARALAELDDYDVRFPTGLMRPEATVVRIEAMVQSGNLAGAKALGRRFLSANPSGGLSVRVRKVIGE